ncbi:MAG TPA: MFS transporter [Candidatus Limnocylindria bacterium]|nr:MFS transporter [Candidatus Limnocylindria bacterium]
MSVDVVPSYRGLFAISGFTRLVASMILARTATEMLALILVLFALQRYESAAVAGAVVFLGAAPGLVMSPVAGALLDRHGRTRLIIFDYLVAGGIMGVIGALSLADRLPVPLLLLLVTVASVTGIFSRVGVRTLFPLIVPKRLWERANAIDSNGYVVAQVAGPALAGAIVAALGAESGLFVTAAVFVLAAVVTIGLRDPGPTGANGPLLSEAWAGVRYVARNGTLRALAISVSTNAVGWGLFFIALPVLVIQHLRGSAADVGVLFALYGATGFLSVLFFGRISTAGRERQLMVGAMVGTALSYLFVLLAPGTLAARFAMALAGLANGPFDIVLFTLRQRRTHPDWLGRAFAVSMALNFSGFPLGSALAGAIVPVSLELALVAAIAFTLLAAVLTWMLIPAREAGALS